MELICWGHRSSWREWCGDEGVEAACREWEGFMWGTVHMASSAVQSPEMRWNPKGGLIWFHHLLTQLLWSYQALIKQPAAFRFVCTVCVCTQCVALHILSVTCLLFAKLFCCKIGQTEKHGRSLCGFHGLYKNACKLHYEHFVISHQKRLTETLKIWGKILSFIGLLFCFFCFLTVFFPYFYFLFTVMLLYIAYITISLQNFDGN